jgi:hypothetical protein
VYLDHCSWREIQDDKLLLDGEVAGIDRAISSSEEALSRVGAILCAFCVPFTVEQYFYSSKSFYRAQTSG